MPLIAPAELTATATHDLPPEQSIRLWMDVMDSCDQLLLAGLRREVGPDGDVRAAYRRWYAGWQEEHDRMWQGMAMRFARCEETRGG